MAKNKPLNQIDQAITVLLTEYMQRIPNYDEKMQDEELRAAHALVAVGMAGIIESRNLVVTSFVPATNKAIVETRKQLRQSAYANILKSMDDNLEELRDETIRLGYVFTFHKFESFIKQLIRYLDNRQDTSTPVTLDKYGEKEFEFNPLAWYKSADIHLVNFISNCTKHQDGFCRLDNPKFTIPDEFMDHSPDEKIVRTVKQYQADVNKLIEKTSGLVKVLMSLYMMRTAELFMADTELLNADISANALAQLQGLKVTLYQEINDYCRPGT